VLDAFKAEKKEQISLKKGEFIRVLRCDDTGTQAMMFCRPCCEAGKKKEKKKKKKEKKKEKKKKKRKKQAKTSQSSRTIPVAPGGRALVPL
jgi:hypothetical protein